MWVWALVIVVLIGAVAVVAVGRDGTMSQVYDDRPDRAIPSGRPLTSDDLREVRFSTAARGYRMDEVDALLARLGADLLARETRELGPTAAEATAAAAGPDAAAAEPGGVSDEAAGIVAAEDAAAEPGGVSDEAAGIVAAEDAAAGPDETPR